MAQLPTRSLRLRSYTTTDLDRLTGEKGEIFYDYEKRTLKVYNGAGVAASTVTVGPADRLVNGSRSLLLAANGALTISGDIRSEGDINIEINLADSTLQRWRFGEDGSLTFPDGTTQTTAWLGAGQPVYTSLIDSLDSSAITVVPAIIFNSDVTVENELNVKTLVNDQSKWSFSANGVLTFPDGTNQTTAFDANYAATITTALGLKAPLANPTFTGTVGGITATMVGLGNVTNQSKATMFTNPVFTGITDMRASSTYVYRDTVSPGSGTTKELDVATMAIWYYSGVTGNFTVDVINLPETTFRATDIAVVIIQGAAAYIPNVLKIGSVTQSIKWQGGSQPTGNANKTDIVSFTLFRVADAFGANERWEVIGSLSTYG